MNSQLSIVSCFKFFADMIKLATMKSVMCVNVQLKNDNLTILSPCSIKSIRALFRIAREYNKSSRPVSGAAKSVGTKLIMITFSYFPSTTALIFASAFSLSLTSMYAES